MSVKKTRRKKAEKLVIIWLPCEPHQRSKCSAHAKFITCRDLVTVENTRKGLAQYSQPFLTALLQKICDSDVQGLTTGPSSSSSGHCNCLARPERRAWPQSFCCFSVLSDVGSRVTALRWYHKERWRFLHGVQRHEGLFYNPHHSSIYFYVDEIYPVPYSRQSCKNRWQRSGTCRNWALFLQWRFNTENH